MEPFNTILAAVDFSENSDHAFEYALTMAKKFDAHLVVLHVVSEQVDVDLRTYYGSTIPFEKLEEDVMSAAEGMMSDFCSRKLGDYENYSTITVGGQPYKEILHTAKEQQATLIVLGTHGRTGIDHMIFGSTAERVVRLSDTPVMTIRTHKSGH